MSITNLDLLKSIIDRYNHLLNSNNIESFSNCLHTSLEWHELGYLFEKHFGWQNHPQFAAVICEIKVLLMICANKYETYNKHSYDEEYQPILA